MNDKAKGFTHDSVKNVSVEWYTPSWVFEKLNLKFDLDPCHPKEKIPWIPVDKTFNIDDDGLSQCWDGLVWLNPPYGKHTSAWLKKMHTHRNGVALVFARTDCKWYHDYITNADAILYLKGRISFVDGFGVTAGSGAGSGSMLVGWGQDAALALSQMSDLGHLHMKGDYDLI